MSTTTTRHEAHGRCASCGFPAHRYPYGWDHVGCGANACPTLAAVPTCCDEHRTAAEFRR